MLLFELLKVIFVGLDSPSSLLSHERSLKQSCWEIWRRPISAGLSSQRRDIIVTELYISWQHSLSSWRVQIHFCNVLTSQWKEDTDAKIGFRNMRLQSRLHREKHFCHNPNASPSPSTKYKIQSQKSNELGVTLFCCATIKFSSNFHSRLT